MRVLLDECLPRRLKHSLEGWEVSTVPEMGWAGKTNGELLRLAAAQFEVFITGDQNLAYQQNLAATTLGVLVLSAKTNTLPDLLPLVPRILEALPTLEPGQVHRLTA